LNLIHRFKIHRVRWLQKFGIHHHFFPWHRFLLGDRSLRFLLDSRDGRILVRLASTAGQVKIPDHRAGLVERLQIK
jgi:hypothetical protein